jgi:hypothetical protein
MKKQEYKKLDIDLPRQRIYNSHPWWIAGWLFVFVLLFIVAFTYFNL